MLFVEKMVVIVSATIVKVIIAESDANTIVI
jgi:hypothetical protein